MKILLFNMVMDGQSTHDLRPVIEWLDAHKVGHKSFTDKVFKGQLDAEFLELSARIRDFDLVCTFGGDGTTLRAAHLIGASEVPLISFNFGHLGFLSGADESDMYEALESALKGELCLDARTILEAQVTYNDHAVEQHLAFNELVVSRGNFGRIVSLDMIVNGNYLDTIRGDGVLVSTSTGSTAYSLSAGGPIMAPGHSGMCMVPISPHSLASRALITTPSDVITIVPNDENRQKLVLFIDGEVFWFTSQEEIVSIRVGQSDKKLLLMRFGKYDFYTHISEVFFRGSNA